MRRLTSPTRSSGSWSAPGGSTGQRSTRRPAPSLAPQAAARRACAARFHPGPPKWRGSAPGSTLTTAAASTAKPGADGKPACRNLDELSHVLAASRNPDSLLDAWVDGRRSAFRCGIATPGS